MSPKDTELERGWGGDRRSCTWRTQCGAGLFFLRIRQYSDWTQRASSSSILASKIRSHYKLRVCFNLALHQWKTHKSSVKIRQVRALSFRESKWIFIYNYLLFYLPRSRIDSSFCILRPVQYCFLPISVRGGQTPATFFPFLSSGSKTQQVVTTHPPCLLRRQPTSHSFIHSFKEQSLGFCCTATLCFSFERHQIRIPFPPPFLMKTSLVLSLSVPTTVSSPRHPPLCPSMCIVAW